MSSSARTRSGAKWDALGPPSLLLFFWITDLLLPYFYAIGARPWERQTGMVSMIRIEDIHLAMLAAAFYLLSWLGGYAAANWTPALKFDMRAPRRSLGMLHLLFNFAVALAIFIVLYALNPSSNFTSRMELTAGPWGKALFLSIGILFAAFWLSATGLLSAAKGRVPLLRIVCALVLAGCMIAVFAPMAGRGRMLIAVLYMIVVWHYFVRPLSTVGAWGFLACGIVLALGMDYVRLGAYYAHIDPLEMTYGLTYGRQFDGILNIAAAMRAVSMDYAHLHFGSAWIADVAGDLGLGAAHANSRVAFMSDVLRMPRFQAGFPLTRPGELFFAFGWPGIVVGAALMGAFARVWYNWLMRTRPFGAASAPVYFTFLMTFGFVTQKNYMFSSLVMALVYVVLILMLAWMAYGYQLNARRASSPVAVRSA